MVMASSQVLPVSKRSIWQYGLAPGCALYKFTPHCPSLRGVDLTIAFTQASADAYVVGRRPKNSRLCE
ncbi:hypothetical protein C8R48DRAFT_706531 [Suillus tomentosus]|nr:hypothetical protein C8R48DRAFT_706531 [Suillus tomentosus]